MAEYIARDSFGGSVTFESAGSAPQPAADAENAIYTLKRNFNLDASNHVPRDIRSLDLESYDLIIALENRVFRLVKELGALESKVKLWKIHDPWGFDLSEYDRCALEIKKQVLKLKKAVNRNTEERPGR